MRARRQQPRLLGCSLAMTMAAGLAGCASGTRDLGATERQATRTPSAAATGLPPAEFPEPGLVHVHGLGVDPADGSLYAASHFGVFRVADGRAERIANRYQDTMGFVVTGPRTFLASGHPDPREDDVRPPLLGLIESRDAGVTWQRLSLHGEADFHALHAAHGQVYGFDSTSGTFMVTADRRTWDRRARVDLASFAVDPDDADHVVAAGAAGALRSTDGGRSWTPLPTPAPPARLAWTREAGLVAVTTDGTLLGSSDGGKRWQRRGSAGGPPEALAVSATGGRVRIHVAVSGKGIVESVNGGSSFAPVYVERTAHG